MRRAHHVGQREQRIVGGRLLNEHVEGGADDTAAAKMKIMAECGITVVQSPADIGATMKKIISK